MRPPTGPPPAGTCCPNFAGQSLDAFHRGKSFRHAGADRLNLTALEGVKFQIGQMMRARDMFFSKEDPMTGREALHQMLRALQYEVPAQM